MRSFKELTKEEIVEAILSSTSMCGALRLLNIHENGGNGKKLIEYAELNNVSISHFKTKITRKLYLENPRYCEHCGKELTFEQRNNRFCSNSCAASVTNKENYSKCKEEGIKYRSVTSGKYLEKEYSTCLNCGKLIPFKNIYCGNKCLTEYLRKQYIERWKRGKETGIIGEGGIATAVKYYLREKYNNSCQLCGWNTVNPHTGIVPLQIHHIDGDCKNNTEENLLLLCPNCHALTENFGSRNQNCTRIDKRAR